MEGGAGLRAVQSAPQPTEFITNSLVRHNLEFDSRNFKIERAVAYLPRVDRRAYYFGSTQKPSILFPGNQEIGCSGVEEKSMAKSTTNPVPRRDLSEERNRRCSGARGESKYVSSAYWPD